MAAPTFAIAGRGQQAIDNFFKSFGRFIGQEIVEFFFGGRKTGEVERGAAEERCFVGLRGGFEAVLFEIGEDELVNGIDDPTRLLRFGRPGVGERLERPEILIEIGDDAAQGDGSNARSR